MNHQTITSASYLVDEFSNDVKQLRREYNHNAAKSMTRLTVMLMLLFFAVWMNWWLSN